LRVEGGRTYFGRPAACHGIVTEDGAIHSDRVAGVSSGHSRPQGRRPKQQGAASRRQDSMSDKRQKNQLQMALAFTGEGRSEAPRGPREGTESLTAKCETESPAGEEQLMEEVCGRENCQQALRRVKANKGSPGIDGMKVSELPGYLKQHWPAIREQLLRGTYKPQPVRRVEIAKPDGGMRKLGIPTVLDRFIQQAVMQVLQRQMGPDVLRAQSRVSSATLGASGGGQGAAVYRPGQPLGGGSGSGKVFRSSEPRQTDGSHSAAGGRQEDAQADTSHPGVGRDGERAGESGGRRNSARRVFVTAAVEPGARRTRPGTGAAPAPFRALRG